MNRTYQISEVARTSGVSVRALHYYDRIGLLTPSNRSAAGYRLYTDADLLRLQQILIARALGLALEDIRKLLDDPNLDRAALLWRQRQALTASLRTTRAMIRSIDAALDFINQLSTEGSPVDMKQLFDGFDPVEYEQEVQARWGRTDSYKESRRRTSAYTAVDWQQFRDENAAIMSDASAAMRAGVTAADAAAMQIAERHRLSIDRWFYPCSREMHCALVDMYEADEHFAKSIDQSGEGLTRFLSAAIRANARTEADGG